MTYVHGVNKLCLLNDYPRIHLLNTQSKLTLAQSSNFHVGLFYSNSLTKPRIKILLQTSSNTTKTHHDSHTTLHFIGLLSSIQITLKQSLFILALLIPLCTKYASRYNTIIIGILQFTIPIISSAKSFLSEFYTYWVYSNLIRTYHNEDITHATFRTYTTNLLNYQRQHHISFLIVTTIQFRSTLFTNSLCNSRYTTDHSSNQTEY